MYFNLTQTIIFHVKSFSWALFKYMIKTTQRIKFAHSSMFGYWIVFRGQPHYATNEATPPQSALTQTATTSSNVFLVKR